MFVSLIYFTPHYNFLKLYRSFPKVFVTETMQLYNDHNCMNVIASKKIGSDILIFSLFSLLWVLFCISALLLAFSGFFYFWILVFTITLLFCGFLAVMYRTKIFPSRTLFLVGICIFFFVIALSYFTEPSIYSGRDHGSIAEAAIHLTQTGKLTFSTSASNVFFDIYGPGKSLNFPGFFYTTDGTLTTQFPVAYIAWIGGFVSLFGLAGFSIANAILIFLFLVAFYLLTREFVGHRWGIIALLFAATSFFLSWLPKFTLSENFALALTWMMIFVLIKLLQIKNPTEQRNAHILYATFILTGILLFFTRIEGMVFFAIACGILLMQKYMRLYIFERGSCSYRIVLPFGLFCIILALSLISNTAFYTTMAKEFLKIGIQETQEAQDIVVVGTMQLFLLYGMLQFFVGALVSIFVLIVKKKWCYLLPLLVILPSTLYLFDPHISNDHPWLLRRYYLSLFPAMILYTTVLLALIFQHTKTMLIKGFVGTTIILLVLAQLPQFLFFFPYTENRGMQNEIATIAENFTLNDLVLVDRHATGDGWSMMTGPLRFLYGKDAAYFFNPKDLTKIDTHSFDNVYLIVPDENVPFYKDSIIGNRLMEFSSYTFSTNRLERVVGATLPQKQDILVHGKIFLIKK